MVRGFKPARFTVRRCPNCDSRNLGKIAKNTYFCWECYLEIVDKDKGWKELQAYEILEDGSLEVLPGT